MNKLLKAMIMIVFVALLFSLTACGIFDKDNTIEKAKYTITFESNGGSEVASITEEAGKVISQPISPTKEGSTFVNWFTDDGIFQNAYKFITMPEENITLYAKWDIIIVLSDLELLWQENKDLFFNIWDQWTEDDVIFTANHPIYGKKAIASEENIFAIEYDNENEIDYDLFTYLTGFYKRFYFERIPNTNILVVDNWSLKYILQGKVSYDETNNMYFDDDNEMLIRYAGSNENITVPNNTISIGDYAFYKCEKLRAITLYEGLNEIEENAFYQCKLLETINIPDSVTRIGITAFSDCDKIKYENIGNLNYLNNWAMGMSTYDADEIIFKPTTIGISGSPYFLNKINTLSIPASVVFIGKNILRLATALTSITVDSYNQKYKSIDGNLYSKDEKVLIKYAAGKTAQSFSVPSSVETIDEYAFYYCTKLTNIDIPDNLATIGRNSFQYCSNLNEITIPDKVTEINNYAFSDCTRLYSIAIPNSVNRIGDYAFNKCSNLSSITIPDSVITIGESAFDECTSLSTVTLSKNLSSINNNTFRSCTNLSSITIPDSITRIGDYAFNNCTNLKSIIIPESVTVFGTGVFSLCASLESITIPDIINSISASMFSFCTSLSAVNIPDGVTELGDYCFAWCENLFSITIPDNVVSIGDNAFYGCKNLTSLVIPDKVNTIGAGAFGDCIMITSITIPDSVNIIKTAPFKSCSGLATITVSEGNTKYHSNGNCLIETSSKKLIQGCNSSVIPTDGSVTSIGMYAFYGFSELTSITIPEDTTSIGDNAFSNCSGLNSIIIPVSVTAMGAYAFSGCSNLTIYARAYSEPDEWNYYWNASDVPVVWGYAD